MNVGGSCPTGLQRMLEPIIPPFAGTRNVNSPSLVAGRAVGCLFHVRSTPTRRLIVDLW